MADTMRGEIPNKYCNDCGKKGCYIKHWGDLIPRTERESGFFDECWQQRVDDREPKPFSYDSTTGLITEYGRAQVIKGMRELLNFLEVTPECDLPESIGENWIRTLTRQSRGQLKDRQSEVEWFVRHVKALTPCDELSSRGDQLGVRKKFSGGVQLWLHVSVNEVPESLNKFRLRW